MICSSELDILKLPFPNYRIGKNYILTIKNTVRLPLTSEERNQVLFVIAMFK